jgi:hypothetical protein
MPTYSVILRAERMTRLPLLAVIDPPQILAGFRRRFRFRIRKPAFSSNEERLFCAAPART